MVEGPETSPRAALDALAEFLRSDAALWKDAFELARAVRFRAPSPGIIGIRSSWTDTSTLPREALDPDVWSRAEEVFQVLSYQAREENFEDGHDSEFSRGLRMFLDVFGRYGLDVLEQYCLEESANTGVLEETFRQLGLIVDGPTLNRRFDLFVKGLNHPAASIRDSAAIGLAYLGDKRAPSLLRKAISREASNELREAFQQMLEELES